jgi:hypothetical protein
MRKIHLDNQVWEYKIGSKNLLLFSPTKSKHVVPFKDLLGEDILAQRIQERKDYLEEMFLENNYRGFSIFPSDVRDYIRALAN